MLWGNTVYLILGPDPGLLVSYSSDCPSVIANQLPYWRILKILVSIVSDWMYSLLLLFIYCAVMRKSTKTFLCFCFAFWKRSCSVSFVNSVNNHPDEGIVYQFLGGSFMLFWGRTVFEVWGFCFFFFCDNAVNKMYVQYLRDFGWLLSSAVSCY